MSDVHDHYLHHVDVHDEALDHFGLKRDPFNWLPQNMADFFYSTDMALVELTCYRTINAPGICAIIGEVGCGKSSAVRRFVENHLARKKQYAVSYLDAPQMRDLRMSHVLQKALHDFTNNMHVGQGLMRTAEGMRNTVEDMADRGMRPVLIIEDAHLLGMDPLKELKLLYELRKRIQPILAIILIGQPELHRKLRRADLRQLAQRCRILKVNGLSSDMVAYVKHRFRKTGREATDLFEPEALKELAAHPAISTPLEVNIICAQALNFTWKQGAERVDRELMFEVLSLHEPDTGSPAIPDEKTQPAAGTSRKVAAA